MKSVSRIACLVVVALVFGCSNSIEKNDYINGARGVVAAIKKWEADHANKNLLFDADVLVHSLQRKVSSDEIRKMSLYKSIGYLRSAMMEVKATQASGLDITKIHASQATMSPFERVQASRLLIETDLKKIDQGMAGDRPAKARK